MKTPLIIGLLCLPLMLMAQQEAVERQIDRIIEDIYGYLAEEEEETPDFSQVQEELTELAESPVNLNTTTRRELERLLFLSDQQIDDILYYVYTYGPLAGMEELRLVGSLRSYDVRNMLPFVYVGAASRQEEPFRWRDAVHYGHHRLTTRLGRTLEHKRGYGGTYAGSPLYASVRYRFRFSNRLVLHLTAEKDAGERWGFNPGRGFDFYSCALVVNHVGHAKQIVVGDFRANFGQGLTIGQDFRLSRSSYSLNVDKRSSGLRPNSSVDEYHFLRGAGATLQLGRNELSVFASHRRVDGRVEQGVFTSINTDGLHRTSLETARRHKVGMSVGGADFTHRSDRLEVGLTATALLLSDTLRPTPMAYNANYFSGTRQLTLGTHYRLRLHSLNLFGETTLNDRLAVATLNGFRFSPVQDVSLVVLHRYYSRRFDNLIGSAFGATSRLNAEQGFYMAAEVSPWKWWRFTASVDSYSFLFPKSGIDRPSNGHFAMLQAAYSPRENLSMQWRVIGQHRLHNLADSIGPFSLFAPRRTASLRYHLEVRTAPLRFITQVDGNRALNAGRWTNGMSLAQEVVWQPAWRRPFSMSVRLQVFDAQTWDNRIYTYERDVQGAFSIPAAYGQGCRYYLNLSWQPLGSLTLWLKASQTVYARQDTIGSGWEAIQGNRKTDLHLQLRWQF